MKRKKIIGSAMAVSVLTVAALTFSRVGAVRAQSAPPPFSAASLTGSCAFRLIANNGQTVVVVGTIAFDGSGNVSGSILQNATGGSGGSTFAQFTGTYTANSDGTGTITFPWGGTNYDIAYAANSGPGVLQWILTNSGTPGIGQCSF